MISYDPLDPLLLHVRGSVCVAIVHSLYRNSKALAYIATQC